MVIHFFELQMTHLSLDMIDAFSYYFSNKEQGFYVCCQNESDLLFGSKEEEEAKYRKKFEENNIANYRFINGETDIISTVKKEVLNNNLCVLHGYFPLIGIYKSFGIRIDLLSKIVVVHWGGEQEINKNFKSFRMKLGFGRRCFCYSKFRCVVVLAESDKVSWNKNYGINNIVVNSYFSSPQNIDMRYNIIERQKKDKVKVMLAHSGHTYSNHIESLRLLKEKYDSVIEEVSCPLCYGPKDYIDEVIKIGQELFGKRFSYFTNLLSKEEYIEYIRSKDVYVTASNIQSGLFALATALGNGLKVYCGQSNFDTYSFKGYTIYKHNDLFKKSKEDFVLPLTEQDIIKNYEKLVDKENVAKIVSKWKEILFENIKF